MQIQVLQHCARRESHSPVSEKWLGSDWAFCPLSAYYTWNVGSKAYTKRAHSNAMWKLIFAMECKSCSLIPVVESAAFNGIRHLENTREKDATGPRANCCPSHP